MNTNTASATTGTARPVDRDFFRRELEQFVPQQVFDAHCHLWLESAVTFRVPDVTGDVGAEAYRRLMEDLHQVGDWELSFSASRFQTDPTSVPA